MRIRLKAAGVESASAPLISTKVDPQTATTSTIRMYARSFICLDYGSRDRSGWREMCGASLYVSGICLFPGNKRLDDFGPENGRRFYVIEVAIHEDEISIVSYRKFAFVLFGKLSVCRSLCVGVERLTARELVVGKIAFGCELVGASDRGIESAKRRDGFDRIIGAKGQRNAGVEKCLPRIGVRSSLRAEAVHCPIHIGEQVVGLHAGDDAESGEAGNVGGIDNLRVLDAIPRCRRDSFLRIGVKRHRSSLVADGMKAQLESGLSTLERHCIQLFLRELRQPSVARIIREGGLHRRGARAKRAVHEPL